jgi:integrase/recombinase XerD
MTRQKPIDILSADQVDSLVAQCSRRAPSGQRDAALIWLLYGACLRIAEALALKPRDVDLDKRQVRVVCGKGGKPRRVGLHPTAVPFLERWLQARADLGAKRSAPLLCLVTKGKIGKPLSRQAAHEMLKRRARKAGIEGRVHAHSLRHSMAVRLAQVQPVSVVSEQLGHSDLKTTTVYLRHLDASDLAAAIAEV